MKLSFSERITLKILLEKKIEEEEETLKKISFSSPDIRDIFEKDISKLKKLKERF